MSLFVTIVLDGVGIGEQPDAGRYGDEGSDTLAHVCRTARPHLPHLTNFGLGCIAPLDGIPPVSAPRASYGRMREVSAGKDSTTGHWELAGLRLDHPFPTYPDGFPAEVIDAFVARTGCGGVLGNRPASGTAVVDELGERHQHTGLPIVYTSADSVFQIAAHVDTLPLDALYRMCRIARDEVCVGAHAVGRVIARPFTGTPGAYTRLSAERKDYALRPPDGTVQETLRRHGIRTVSVGKIADLFGGFGFDEAYKTKSNDEGVAVTIEQMRAAARRYERERLPTFIWVNLVDFDQDYGHRNDPYGFARALEAFDRSLPGIVEALPPGGRLVVTADHGNDPTTPSTDHSREYVPLLVYDPGRESAPRDMGVRSSFNDHAAAVAAHFDVPYRTDGTAF